MKTILKTLAAFVFMIILMNDSFAQEFTAQSTNGATGAKNEMLVNTNVASHTNAARNTEPGNSRIATKFSALFPAADNQQWSTDAKGYWVSFVNEGRKTRAGFNNNGQLNYRIADCSMDQLSTEFQNFIAKNYAGYQLFNAIEINAFGEQTQRAILQNASAFVTLQATKDGIEEIQKMNKAN
jgi:hypothetical protein